MTMHEWLHHVIVLARKAKAGEIPESDVYAWAEKNKTAYKKWAKAQIEKK